MTDQLELIRKRCIEANPEIGKRLATVRQRHTDYLGADSTIRLADVLLAIDEQYKQEVHADPLGAPGHLGRRGANMGILCGPGGYQWNFREDDLTKQSPETVSFLYDLLE